MANEWVLVDRTEDPLDYVVTNATGIEKGALLKLAESGTAIISSAIKDVCAGVSAREKIASDGRTQLAVFKKGRFRATGSGTITTGSPLMSAAAAGFPNIVQSAATVVAVSGAAIIGYAEADAAAGETLQVRLDL